MESGRKKYALLLMAGHIAVDICQGALPAALPFLVSYHGLSLTAAGGLMLALTGISSLIQPLLGYLSDKAADPRLMSLGIFIAGAGFSVLGLARTYSTMFLCVVICGIGVAIFHPEGGRMVNCITKTGKGEAMSLFSVGGNIGFALGPILVVILIFLFDIKGLVFIIFPPLAVALLLQYNIKNLQQFSLEEKKERERKIESEHGNDWKAFSILSIILFIDSIVDYGMVTYLPLFWLIVLGRSESLSSSILAIVTIMGTLSTYAGGLLADRHGFRKVIIWGSFIYAPVIFLVGFSTGTIMAFISVILLGLTSDIVQSPAVALGQSFLPNNVGLASGITLGLAVSIGGLASPILGYIGDSFGLVSLIFILATLCTLAAFLTLLIPKYRAEEK